jgi:hypothetical protein
MALVQSAVGSPQRCPPLRANTHRDLLIGRVFPDVNAVGQHRIAVICQSSIVLPGM